MQIKLIRTKNSAIGHILFYAWSNNPGDDFYLDPDNNQITEIKLDYNREDSLNLISPYDRKFDRSTIKMNPEDEEEINVSHVVLLQSDISFSRFCEKLINKGYGTNVGYNLLSNNCVDATRYALKVAKIHNRVYCLAPSDIAKRNLQSMKQGNFPKITFDQAFSLAMVLFLNNPEILLCCHLVMEIRIQKPM